MRTGARETFSLGVLFQEYVYVCACVCVYIYVCRERDTHIYIYTGTHTSMVIYSRIFAEVQTVQYTHTFTYTACITTYFACMYRYRYRHTVHTQPKETEPASTKARHNVTQRWLYLSISPLYLPYRPSSGSQTNLLS